MKLHTLAYTAVCALILIGALTNLAFAENPSESCLLSNGGDRLQCETECRYRYGASSIPYELQFGGGYGGYGTYYALARCIQECNDKFWKEFDKDTGKGPTKP